MKLCFILTVGVTGLEPATAWSQTRNATNCATPRFRLYQQPQSIGFPDCGCKGTKKLCNSKIFPSHFSYKQKE